MSMRGIGKCGQIGCDCSLPCQICPSGGPSYIEVTISGVTYTAPGGGSNCNDCSAMNGVYILTFVKPCVYRYLFESHLGCNQITSPSFSTVQGLQGIEASYLQGPPRVRVFIGRYFAGADNIDFTAGSVNGIYPDLQFDSGEIVEQSPGLFVVSNCKGLDKTSISTDFTPARGLQPNGCDFSSLVVTARAIA